MAIIIIDFNLKNLNPSLQVGDLVYAQTTNKQIPLGVSEGELLDENALIGILRKIDVNSISGIIQLHIDTEENGVPVGANLYTPKPNDFIMFSKYNQSMGDVIGYYAKVRFANNSNKKAEIFSVGSEIIINSK
tara:strand:- start:291 stop:689 length:399 start_codon:yes stop_codon:yes gene_type:complete